MKWRPGMELAKFCIKCHERKPYSEYYGSTNTCKTCQKLREKRRRLAKSGVQADAPIMAVESGAPDASIASPAVEAEQAPLPLIRVRQLAEWYSDRAYWHYSPAALAAGELDAELQAVLRREVGPDRAEVEFARVLRMAHRE